MNKTAITLRLYGFENMAVFCELSDQEKDSSHHSIGTSMSHTTNETLLTAWSHVWNVLTAQCNIMPLNSPVMLVGTPIDEEPNPGGLKTAIDTATVVKTIGDNLEHFDHDILQLLNTEWFPNQIKSLTGQYDTISVH